MKECSLMLMRFAFLCRKHLSSTHLGRLEGGSLLSLHSTLFFLLQDQNFNAGPDTVKLFLRPAERRRCSFEMVLSHIKDLFILAHPCKAVVMR